MADPTEVDPIEARALEKGELLKLLHDYPLTRGDLERILRSKRMTKKEIKDVFNAFLQESK